MKTKYLIISFLMCFFSTSLLYAQLGINNGSIFTSTRNSSVSSGQILNAQLEYNHIEPNAPNPLNNACKSNMVIEITYDPTFVALTTTSVSGLSQLGFTPIGSSAGMMKFKNSTQADGFNTSGFFSTSFRLLTNDCVIQNTEIKYKIYYECENGTVNPDFNTQTVYDYITINPTNSTPYVSLERITPEVECEKKSVLYLINSFGSDVPNASIITFELPQGMILNEVYNTAGNPYPFTNLGNGLYSIERDVTTNRLFQQFYLDVYIDNIECETEYKIPLRFDTHEICGNVSQPQATTVFDSYIFTTCDCGSGGGDGSSCKIEGVLFSKSLTKTPFRYYGAPDNCKEHFYTLKVTNFSNQDITSALIRDYIKDLITSTNDEIDITSITLSYKNYLNTTWDAEVTGNNCTGFPTTGLTHGTTINIPFSTSCYLSDDIEYEISKLPRYGELTLKINHRLVDAQIGDVLTNNALIKVFGQVGNVVVKSEVEKVYPVMNVFKKVRNVTAGGGFSTSINALPGDELEYQIQVQNYGITEATGFQLTDILDCDKIQIIPSSFTYSGNEGETATNITSSGFTFGNNFKFPASPCENGHVLTINYRAKVTDVKCFEECSNLAKITFDDVANNPYTSNLTSSTAVTIDLFQGIDYKYEVSDCRGNYGRNVEAMPGDVINYKISIRNTSHQPRNIALQAAFPNSNGTITYGTTTLAHTGSTFVNPSLISNTFVNSGIFTNSFIPNYLNNPVIITSSTPNNAYQWNGIIPANTIIPIELIYQVQVPYSTPLGSVVETDLGIVINPGADCSKVRKTSNKVTIVKSTCGYQVEPCEQLKYTKSIKKVSNDTFDICLDFNWDYTTNVFDDLNVVINPWLVYNNATGSNSFYNVTLVGTFPLSNSTGMNVTANGQNSFVLSSGSNLNNGGTLCFRVKVTSNQTSFSFTDIDFQLDMSFANKAEKCKLCEELQIVSYQDNLSVKEDVLTKHESLIFPNPAKEFIQIKLPNEFINQKTLIQIVDLNGKLIHRLWVFEDDVMDRKGENNNLIDNDQTIRTSNTTPPISVKSLPSGVYMVLLSSENNKKSMKFIKQ